MKKIDVAIVMGSDSDLNIMSAAANFFEKLGIAYEITIASAHRTPELLREFIKTAIACEVKVIIAGAGGAAHLPGVIASMVDVPVIGVPIKTSALSGLDSLYSIVQMPSGVPVATVSINGALNAGILAAQILSLSNSEFSVKLKLYKDNMKNEVIQKADKLRETGFANYIFS
ncbi:MAG: 5-(carboxyamino)imidazole ribonucleotide mutase [Clostridiales bacterium]|nr:5-(carboxyamino)imidazole ribonucleotide mutase [Clostridiales bacterium]